MDSPKWLPADSGLRRAMTNSRYSPDTGDGGCELALGRQLPPPVRECRETTGLSLGRQRIFDGIQPPVFAEVEPYRCKTRVAHTRSRVREIQATTRGHA